jgi:large subunit ribosomal protein L13
LATIRALKISGSLAGRDLRGFSGAAKATPQDLPETLFVLLRGLISKHFLELCMKTVSVRAQDVDRAWIVIDAADQVLGRLATEVAHRLRGKHKPAFTPHVDTGDFVIVVNADKIRVTGNKTTDKQYYRHSGYPGGIKSVNFEKLRDTHPERIIEKAVKGMLPKNPLGRAMFRKLKVYGGSEHPHAAQQPQPLEL